MPGEPEQIKNILFPPRCHLRAREPEDMSMISVVIPTLNAAPHLAGPLCSLVEGMCQGLIKEVIVSDGGSDDGTSDIAEGVGARLVVGAAGRGAQLARGAAVARGAWLLFLHADTQLAPGWERVAERHMQESYERVAGVFRLRFDRPGLRPALVAMGANLRTALFKRPYGDQGLLIARRHYDDIGGFAPLPLFEDVDFIQRLVERGGRRALRGLPITAITAADRYEAEGYFRRVGRNAALRRAYRRGVPPTDLAERYYAPSPTRLDPYGKAAAHRARQDTLGP